MTFPGHLRRLDSYSGKEKVPRLGEGLKTLYTIIKVLSREANGIQKMRDGLSMPVFPGGIFSLRKFLCSFMKSVFLTTVYNQFPRNP